MKSMTGYAFREKHGEGVSLSVEIRSWNSRFLEISVALPPWLSGLERRIRDYIASRNGRGKIEISVRLREHNAPVTVSVNRAAAAAYREAINELAAGLELPGEADLSTLLGMEGVLEIERNRDNERYWQEMEEVLKGAVDDLEEEKIREGRYTEADILLYVGKIGEAVKTVASMAPLLEASIKENLRTRFAEVLEARIDENRVLAETAVLLLKYTISEELSRLSSHLAEFRAETARNPGPGKKLDFLCQEINREINTIGSKTPVLEVSRAVVEMKDALENIREQLRNVE
ncbi:MAG: YicC family protein [Treponema sp.]|nr:YicC family protein [Treponema sp.]